MRVIRQEMERHARALSQRGMDGALATEPLAEDRSLGEQGGDVGRRDGRGTRDEMALEVLRRG